MLIRICREYLKIRKNSLSFYLLGNCVVLQFSKLQKSLLMEVSRANGSYDSDFFMKVQRKTLKNQAFISFLKKI